MQPHPSAQVVAHEPNPRVEDWHRDALSQQRAALACFQHGLHKEAYVHAGFALECALKSVIMHRERMNRWPRMRERSELYDHAPQRLLALAGLEASIQDEVLAGSPVGIAWLVAKDFQYNRRYPDRVTFPKSLAEDMLHALDEQGLIRWILSQKI